MGETFARAYKIERPVVVSMCPAGGLERKLFRRSPSKDDESGPEQTAPNGVTDERNSTPPLHLIK